MQVKAIEIITAVVMQTVLVVLVSLACSYPSWAWAVCLLVCLRLVSASTGDRLKITFQRTIDASGTSKMKAAIADARLPYGFDRLPFLNSTYAALCEWDTGMSAEL